MSDLDSRVNRIMKDIKDYGDSIAIEKLIKNNKIEFEYNEKKYLIKLLNLKEKQELNELRAKKFGQLMKDKDILTEENIIKQFREKGIFEIDEIDNQLKSIEAEISSIQLQLGDALAKNLNDSILREYKEKIENKNIEKQSLKLRKNLLLELSLENQLEGYVYQVLTYLSLYIVEETEKRVFSNFEEFLTYKDESLINKAGTYSVYLNYV